ncbi:hypothetical protein AB0M28_37960 [Streptomyces sp. NPDC051940]|uniref:hypothetical protein n=1 Tax=Streptomyces sp. NPDC051940 TaxID=3155675 RepID=UPI00342B5722
MNGKKAAATAALALAVLGAGAAPVAAQEEADAKAYRTAEGAQQVKGAASSADGPMLEAGTTYLDTIDPGEELYYKITLDARSSTYVAFVAIPDPDDKVAYGDGFTASVRAADNTECGGDEEKFGLDNRSRPIAEAVGRRIGPDEDCQQAGVYNVVIKRTSDPTSTPNPWKLEIRPNAEPPVKTAPGGEAATWPEATPPPNAASETKPITGGSGFSTAAGMYDGVWKDKVLPGQTRYYRVPLDWGQSLTTYAEFGTVPVTDESAWLGDAVSVEYYAPNGWHVGGEAEGYNGREQSQVVNYTPRIDFKNRDSDDVNAYKYAGWYVVAVHVHKDVAKFVKGAVPVTLRTSVKGKPTEGPVYDGDAVKAGYAVGDDDRDAARKGLTAAQADEGGIRTTLGYVGIGAGVLLLLGLAAWWLLARRQAVPAPAGTPNPYQQQQQPPGGGYGYPQQ